MAVSTIAYLKEIARQNATQDTNFLRRMLYFFELQIPDSLQSIEGVSGSFLFPLIIPPESYDMEEPFSVEETGTIGGGLYVEENGIVRRIIHLKGHTGFKPRTLGRSSGMGSSRPIAAMLPPDKKSYSRSLPNTPLVYAISGQRHFQYLQDSVFRTYADLKRDPSTAAETRLIFHNPKDEEHWEVVPRKFSLNRSKQTRVLYHYDIELLVVGPADQINADFSEDKNIFDSLRDGLRTVKRAVDMVTGAVHDLTALQAEIGSYVHNISTILRSVGTVLNASENFVNGTTTLIQTPYSSLTAAIELVENANRLIAAQKELGTTFEEFPEHTIQKFRQLQDALEQLGTSPSNWETSSESTLRKIQSQQDLNSLISTSRKNAALARTPTTLAEVRALGSSLTAGDVLYAEGAPRTNRSLNQYRSMLQVPLGQGDTLVSLAAKYLGDARLWQHIAVVNGLTPPFIDSQADSPLVGSVSVGSQTTGRVTGADELPYGNVLGVGSLINIPTNSASTLDLPLLPVMGAKTGESAESQFLGTDIQLEKVGNAAQSDTALYDVCIDTELGSTDVKTVTGLANLEQVVLTRVTVERGTDVLYRTLGIKRIVGLGFTPVDLENAKFRLMESLANDARIANVTNVEYEQTGDAFYADLKIAIRGFAESRPIRLVL